MRGGTGSEEGNGPGAAASGSESSKSVPERDRRLGRTVKVVGAIVAVFGAGWAVFTWWVDHDPYDPEVLVDATGESGTIYESDSTDVTVDLRNIGDDDVKEVVLAIGSTECSTGTDLPSGEARTGLTCRAPAREVSEAGEVLVLDGAGIQVGFGPVDVDVDPTPCPRPDVGPRGTEAPTVDEFVERWNAAVAATRDAPDPGTADACEDLGTTWEIDPSDPGTLGANVGEHSRVNWDVDVQDRLLNVSIFLASGGVGDDQLRRDVLRGVLRNAVAGDRDEANRLIDNWSAECTGSSTVEIHDDPDVLAVRFC